MKRNIFDDNIDFKALIGKFIAKWYYFAFSLTVVIALAFVYLKIADKVFEIESTIQLNENTYKYATEDKLSVLSDLMKKQIVIEDEIGMLSSYEMIGRAIEQLDFTVSYYAKSDFLGIDNSKEIYNSGLKVTLEEGSLQPISLPIHITFLENDKMRIYAEGEEVKLYDVIKDEILKEPVQKISFEKELSVFAPVRSQYLNFELAIDSTFSFEPGSEYYFIINTKEKLIDHYREKLKIAQLAEGSNIIQIITTGNVVEKEKTFLNTLMRTFIEHDLQKKNQYGLKAIEFIDSQLSKVSDSLNNVEGVLESFRTDNNIVDIKLTSESLTSRLNELETKRAELSRQNEFYKSIAKSLVRDGDLNSVVAPSTVGIQDPLLNNLLLELSRLQQEKISVSYSSAKNNPVLKVLESKIANTKASLQENVDNLIKSTQGTLHQLDGEIRSYREQLNKLPQNERNMIDLQRKFTHNDNVYNFLLQKRAEAGIAVASNAADKSIVDEARMAGNGPTSPKPLKILVIAFLAGLLFPIGLVVVKDFFNDKITSKDELQNATDIPILESIVRAEYRGSKNAENVKNKLMLDESFKFARANLQYMYGNNTCKVIGVTSSIEGEGKTFCSSFLGSSFARSGKKTLLICGDLHKPRIKEYFNIKDQPGIGDFLTQKHTLDEVIQSTEIHSLDVIAPGNVMYDPSSLLELPQMYELFSAVRSKYAYVIVETPPVGYVADYLLMAKHFDINLLIVRHNYTEKKLLLSTEELLKEKQVKNLNILFNGVKTNGDAQYKYRKKVSSYRNS